MTVTNTEYHDALLWTANLNEYRALVALRDADEEFGNYARHCHADDWKTYRFKQTNGTGNINHLPLHAQVEWESQVKSSNDALDLHCETYADPAVMAAIHLVLTNAPDVDALETKIQIIKKHELDNYTPMTVDPFSVITQDVARLRGAQ